MISKIGIQNSLKSLPAPLKKIMRFLIIIPLRIYIRFGPFSVGKLMLYNSFADHLWWLETNVNCLTFFGSTLQVDASDIVGKHIYYFGIWEPDLTHWIQRRLIPGDLFIDVGANIGYYSLLASKLVGNSGKVVSVEALPQTFYRLEDNLRRNNSNNARAVNFAAWDKIEKVNIFTRQEGPSGSTTLISDWAYKWHLQQQIQIDAKPLSLILTPEEIKTARLIKIDVEGAEWHVITEMKSWLAQTRKELEIAIEISLSMMQNQGKNFQDILNVFSDFGFQCYRIQNDYLASTCLQENRYNPPKRIKKWPNEPVDQIDLIFSRIDAESL